MTEDIYKLFTKIKSESNEFRPLSAEIDVTYSCPCKCVHCYQENLRMTKRKEMDTQDIINLINDLHDLGTIECTISGGDPLCRKDIWIILKHLKAKKIRTVLYTSGYFLNEQICRYIADLRVSRVEMTLLSSMENAHNELSGKAEAYQRIIDGVKCLKSYKVPIRLKYMLLHTNYSGLEKLELIENELDEKIDIIPYLWCKHEGTEAEIAPLRITNDELEAFFTKYPFPKKENRYFNCNAGRYKIAIDPFGNVKPCNAFSEKNCVGNVKENSIKEIWFSNNTFLKMRNAIR